LQGDVVAVVGEDGLVYGEYTYDAWGNVLSATGIAPEVNPIRYRGYYWDAEIGCYYLQSRYYVPEWGRFLNADCIIVAGNVLTATNMYGYCNNNPVMMIDKTGRQADWIDAIDWGKIGFYTLVGIGIFLALPFVAAFNIIPLMTQEDIDNLTQIVNVIGGLFGWALGGAVSMLGGINWGGLLQSLFELILLPFKLIAGLFQLFAGLFGGKDDVKPPEPPGPPPDPGQPPIIVSGVTVSPNSVPSLKVGSTQTLQASVTVTPNSSQYKGVSWSIVSGSSYVTITPNGSTCIVTAKDVGTATIKATSTQDPSRSATCSVTVDPATAMLTITYRGNGHTHGTVPTNHTAVTPGTFVIKQPGTMAKTDYMFDGWRDEAGYKWNAGQTHTGQLRLAAHGY